MNKKTLITIGASVVGVFVVLLIVLWIISKVAPSYGSYEEVESYMAKQAEKYYNDNAANLPSEDGTYILYYDTLLSSEYVKPLSEYLKNGSSCTGKVTVIKKDTDYTFIPYLNCGEEYQTKELYQQILNDNPVVVSEKGLYQSVTGEYYFRGNVKNNYVAFGKKKIKKESVDILWRVISIKDHVVKLRAVEAIEEKAYWDRRYNENIKKTYGYNDFETSEYKDFLIDFNNDNSYLSAKNMNMLVPSKLCIGSRNSIDSTINGESECSVLSQDEYYFTTLLPYEYMRASLDPNCNSLTSKSCINLNYLYNKNQYEEWTTIKDADSSYQVYTFNGTTYALTAVKYKKYFYPVIELNEYSFYESGDGSLENPYLVRQEK